jgi:hypothetical protein
MTDHWNFLFHKASGKYITYIGDDDAFLPSALEDLCNSLELRDPDLIWTQPAGYGWPNQEFDGNFFQTVRGKKQRVNLHRARQRLLKLESLDIPIPYNYALFKRDVALRFLQENPNENFFSSRVPDINSGVKVLFLARTQYDYKRLTFISGASPLSNGLLTRTDQDHPVALEFNNPEFNPISFRLDSKIKDISPFGFVTYFEAIEESLLQLGVKLKCNDRTVAFRSVLQSSFPKQQLEISLKVWSRNRISLRLAFLLSRVRQNPVLMYLTRFIHHASLASKVVFQREKVVIIKGPGIDNTFNLVNYLEANYASISSKAFTKMYVR